jgi:hypothetical protein
MQVSMQLTWWTVIGDGHRTWSELLLAFDPRTCLKEPNRLRKSRQETLSRAIDIWSISYVRFHISQMPFRNLDSLLNSRKCVCVSCDRTRKQYSHIPKVCSWNNGTLNRFIMFLKEKSWKKNDSRIAIAMFPKRDKNMFKDLKTWITISNDFIIMFFRL